jgi:hypothetical protein
MKTTIKANQPTFLKKHPEQSVLLADNQKILVTPNKSYTGEIFETVGSHDKIRLSHGAGDWWLYRPHWQIKSSSGSAKFSLDQPPPGSRSYVWGELRFSDGATFTASSGAPGFQYAGAHTIRGRGCIPPAPDWVINLPGYHLNTCGIEGIFWHITPDPRFGRSQLGLHRDANALGSAGCIVVPTVEFPRLKTYLDRLSRTQKAIALAVVYS